MDVENGLPFLSSSINTILVTDSFHYISNKTFFIKEASRILQKDGGLAILHTSRVKHKGSQEKGISPQRINRLLKDNGFKNISLLSNFSLWKIIFNRISLHLGTSDPKKILNTNWIYSIIASKNNSFRLLQFKKKDYKLFTSANIDYSLDISLQTSLYLDRIRNKYDAIFFISPHLDDAVLSCGSLIKELCNKNITVVTVFSKPSPPPYSITAIDFLKKCGYQDAEKLFQIRKLEDLQAMRHLSCSYIHLDFIDAAWRKSLYYIKYPFLQPLLFKFPFFMHTYWSPHQQFSGLISWQDKHLIKKINSLITSLLPHNKRVLILAPLGIGGHADHVIIREAVKEMESDSLFWEDIPYNMSNGVTNSFLANHKEYLLTLALCETKKRNNSIKCYKSQLPVLFPSGEIPQLTESFYLSSGHRPSWK